VRKPIALTTVLVSLVAVASGCGSGKSSSAAATSTQATPAASTARPTTAVAVRKTGYGRVLVDSRGRALYLFTRDHKGASRCYGACAAAWPPYYSHGSTRGDAGTKAGLVGTTKRSDGNRQLTYAGQPLYYFQGDRKPGQITCQNVAEFGGTWLVVKPSGVAVR
jgi:predicted lipoprotein with Yx(FWY)xxD motif